MTPVLAFDIESVPDIEGLRRLYALRPEVKAGDVAEMAFQMRRQTTGTDFLPLHLHRVVAIACALRDRDGFTVWSLGDVHTGEAELIKRFFDGVEKYTPQLVSWNGGGFDLPVMHYRGLIHGVRAARYWDLGEDDKDFKWNNYISRYHQRHLDLMDLLALYQPRNNVPLDEMAKLIGFPGKLGMEGAGVWEAYQAEKIAEIRNYCETDAVNTYLLYLRFQLMRGVFSEDQYRRECDVVRANLSKSAEPHWREFLNEWRAA
ncbi:MAG TPA: 3'-5' exonuclease [Burkholderiales bacterium]|nr:3'-5' exonuclease [Burkholderiales bacterium]